MANKILNLDLAKEPKLNPIIYGRVGDQDMQTVTVNTTRRDEQINLSGYTVTFEGVTGGNTKIFDVAGIDGTDIAKGTLKYTFPNMAFAAEGKYKRAYFSFVKDGKRDTTGDFTIIVLNDADIDADEAETIITEYNKLVEKLNQAYKDAIDQMNKDYEAVQEKIIGIMAELSALKIKIEAYQKSVEKTADEAIYKISTATSEALTAVADAITKLESADVIDKADLQEYLTGGKLSANHTSDFKNKVPGSDVENPHFIGNRQNLTALNPPTANWTELDPYEIRSVSALDNNLYTVRSEKKDEIVQIVIKWDLIKDIERKNPGTFDLYGATDLARKVEVAKKLIVEKGLNPAVFCNGSGPGGNRVYMQIAHRDKTYKGGATNNTSDIRKLFYTTDAGAYLHDDGFVYIIVYAPASDGTTPSVVNIDYVSLDYTLETSMIDLYASKSEFEAHTSDKENPHSTTAAQVKAVALTGNEDILGVKNFKDKIIAKELDTIITRHRYSYSGVGQVETGKTKAFSADNMKLELIRQGDIVYAYMRCNIADLSILGNSVSIVFTVPEGFKRAKDVATNVWNIPFSTAQFTAPQGSYVGLYEAGAIRFWGNRTGNVYLSALWHTDDLLPSN